VRAVLTGAEDEVYLLRRRVVAAEGFGRFRGKPRLAADKRQSMRTGQRTKINWRERFLIHEINHGKGVVSAASVVRNVCGLAVAGCDHFVRIVAYGNPRQHLQSSRIDDGERVVALAQRQQSRFRRTLRNNQRRNEQQNGERTSLLEHGVHPRKNDAVEF
jgi:hypothetical protein